MSYEQLEQAHKTYVQICTEAVQKAQLCLPNNQFVTGVAAQFYKRKSLSLKQLEALLEIIEKHESK